MPKSKRSKIIHLNKTKKKVKQRKTDLVESIKEALSQYVYVYVFYPRNLRNSKIQELRTLLKPSRIYMGKNKLMRVALGNTPESETHPNLSKVAQKLVGYCGLLFTNEKQEYITKVLNECVEDNFARAGYKATETIILPAGPLSGFAPSQEPLLRGLGLPSALKKGVIELLGDYTVCKKDDALSPEQAKLVALLGYKMAQFHIELVSCWHDGNYQELSSIDSPTESPTEYDDELIKKNNTIDDNMIDDNKADENHQPEEENIDHGDHGDVGMGEEKKEEE